MTNPTEQSRLETHKKTASEEDGRRRRQETSLSIRKQKKHEQLAKKRNMHVVDTEKNNEEKPDTEPTYEVSDLPELVKMITNPSCEEELLGAVHAIRSMLSSANNPPVQKVILAGAVDPLVQVLLKSDTDCIVFETAWALTNIASSQWTSVVVNAGIVPAIVPLLLSGNGDIRDQAAWCLGNIAGDCPAYRDMVIESNAIIPLLRNVEQPHSKELLGNVTWTLSNLCRGTPKPPQAAVKEMLPAFKYILNGAPEDVFIDALWALSYCSDGPDDRIADVMELDIHKQLVDILNSGAKSKILIPALRTVGNFVTGTTEQTQMVVDAGILEVCGKLLYHPRQCIRKETCWLVSNVAAGTTAQINKVIHKRSVLQNIVESSKSAEWLVRKEAIFAIANIVSGGTPDQARFMVDRGVIEAFCGILHMSGDTLITITAMEAIECLLKLDVQMGTSDNILLLEEHGGLSLLDELQLHQEEVVYKTAQRILDNYFGEEDEVENLAPADQGDQFEFGLPAKQLFTSPKHSKQSFEFGGTSSMNSPRTMRF